MSDHDAFPGSTAPPIDCIAAVERLWDHLDDELDTAWWAQVEAHRAACAECASHFAFAEGLLAHIAAARADAGGLRALEQRVRARLRTAGYAGRNA